MGKARKIKRKIEKKKERRQEKKEEEYEYVRTRSADYFESRGAIGEGQNILFLRKKKI